MPLLRRRPFVKQKLPSDLTLDEEVFHCTLTNEIFRDYEKFFERIILCNSLVWTCAITGRPGLTYQEALESESRARKQLASFPEHLQRVVLYLSTLTHRSRLTDINDDVFVFVKDRFFINEIVDAMVDGQRKVCRVIKVISPDTDKNEKKKSISLEIDDSDDDVICLDDPLPDQKVAPKKQKAKDDKSAKPCSVEPSQYQYVLQELKKPNIYVLQASQLSRKKGLLTRDKCKLYLKQHCDTSQDGIWRVKAKYAKKFKLSELTFDDFCGGPAPCFAVSSVKRKPSSTPLGPCTSLVDLTEEDSLIRKAKKEHKERREKKLKKSEKKIASLEDQLSQARMNIQEREILREKLREERLARKEEMKQRLDEEKQRRKAEKAKEREEKRQERLKREATLREWSRPRDDMECDDLKAVYLIREIEHSKLKQVREKINQSERYVKDLPVPTRIEGLIDTQQFGDAIMVLEFLQCFSALLDVKDTFPHGISFEEFAKALKEPTVNGLFNDLLYFLLTSIFNMQEQEENEEEQDITSDDTNMKIEGVGDYENISYDELVKQATVASQWPQASYGVSLRNLPLDGFTLTEILRLHFMSSGAKATPSNVKWHYQQRGGYTPLDDAGLEFRQQEADLMKSLGQKSVFEMTVEEKLKVLQALVQQLLTYVSVRDIIEDSHEKLRQVRNELRQYQWAGQRRDRDEANFWYKKRVDEKLKEMEKKAEKKEEPEGAGADKEADKDKSDVIDLTENKQPDSSKTAENKKAERKSERQKAAAEKEKGFEDLLTENIDWENISEEERRSMKERFLKHERQLTEVIDELQHSNAISPIGRDRTYRRYWVFRCLPGVFVEDDERYISDDVLQPVDQTNVMNPLCKKTSLSPGGIPAEDKSTNSDKENESFEQGRSVWGSGNVDKSLSLSNNNNVNDDNDVSVKSDSAALGEKPVVSIESVHEQIKNRNSVCWAYFSSETELDRLIESLNPRGYREGALKLALLEQKGRLARSLQECPVSVLNPTLAAPDKKQRPSNNKSSRSKLTIASYSTPQEALELNLREMLLDLEERIYIGSLGAIKVKDRLVWRDAIEKGHYDPQSDNLPSGDKNTSKCSEEPCGSTDAETDTEGSSSVALTTELARALLQIQQSVEARYLKPPLGTAEEKRSKKKAARSKDKEEEKDEEAEAKSALAVLDRWRESLLASQSLSQVFLHLSVLEKSIMWSKSALHARCRICRRKGDGEHMLLCDGCDRGHHMYCLKPPVLKVPDGDWYCPECRPKEVVRTPRKHRRSFYEDSDTEDQDQVVAVSSEDSEDHSTEEEEEEEEEEEADDSDDEEEDGTEEEDEEEEEEKEEEDKPAKIKFIKGRWKPSTAVAVSGTSTPASSHPNSRSSSRAATPKEGVEGRVKGGGRASTKTRSLGTGGATVAAQTSRSKPATQTGKRTRHSIETERPSKVTRRSNEPKAEQTRRSLEPKKTTRTSQGGKRKSNPDSTSQAPASKQQKTQVTAATTKVRGSDQRLLVMKQCEGLVQELTDRDESWPFLKPVTRRDAPDYFDIVKTPMDFQRMRNKINKIEYTDPAEMVDDIRRIFYNCQQYNMPTAPEYAAGQKMSRFFEKRLRELSIDQYLSRAVGKSPTKSPARGQKAGGRRK